MHRIPADTNTSAEGILWIFSAIWFGVLGFIAFVAPVDAGLFCAAVPGMVPLAIAVRTVRTRRRYGNSEFEMTGSTHVGGRLEGVLHLTCPAGDEDRITATLAFAVPPEPHELGHSRFPVRIDIPATCSPTGRDGAFWWLVVGAEHGLPALDLKFDVFVEGAPTDSGPSKAV